MRRLLLSNTLNTRDLGGYPTGTGGCTCFSRFLRSDLPYALTDADASRLIGMGITTVVDLRSTRETEQAPSFFENREGFAYRHCPLHGNGKRPADEKDIPASYLNLLADSSVLFDIMKIFADAECGVLFHCTAGKDRTGVIAALLLSLAGVPLPDILADYQISYTYIRPMVERLRAADPSFPRWAGQSKPEYMAAFLSAFCEKYQSVAQYLTGLGLSRRDIVKIKSKLISC